jgi:hypothetical protein
MHIVESLRNPSEHVPAATGTVNEDSHGPRKSRSNSTLRCIRQPEASRRGCEHESHRASQKSLQSANAPTPTSISLQQNAHQGLCTGMNLASCNVAYQRWHSCC